MSEEKSVPVYITIHDEPRYENVHIHIYKDKPVVLSCNGQLWNITTSNNEDGTHIHIHRL